ncbi:hypothetical protein [Mesobacillus zeae]|uniref:Uncharacterized protein n=1 Tax=Mesobacillus zeae TaxID=1917180 RepID=A0A398AWD3_9BACI|nr:hypothetical protein [Mesobacillus zeae]RID82039.1 hypothetical protein D1970_20180 [Mesobacillus zeae]
MESEQSRKKVAEKPLLYIIHPDFNIDDFSMQGNYHHVPKRTVEDTVDIIPEEMNESGRFSIEFEFDTRDLVRDVIDVKSVADLVLEADYTEAEESRDEETTLSVKTETAGTILLQGPEFDSEGLLEDEYTIMLGPCTEQGAEIELCNKSDTEQNLELEMEKCVELENEREQEVEFDLEPEDESNIVPDTEHGTGRVPVLEGERIDFQVESVESFSHTYVEDKNNSSETVKKQILLLVRYPPVLAKPMCEIVYNKKMLRAQVISKRGNKVKLKIGRRHKIVEIDDIQDLRVL